MNVKAELDRHVAAAENDVLAARQAIIDALQSHIAIRARTIVIDDAGLAQELDDRLEQAKRHLVDVQSRRERADEIMTRIREYDIETLRKDINLYTEMLRTGVSHVMDGNRLRPTGKPITERDCKSFQARLETAQGEMEKLESLQRELESLAAAE